MVCHWRDGYVGVLLHTPFKSYFFYTKVDWLDIIGILYFIFLNDPGILFLEYANGLDILLAGYYWNSSYYIPLYDLLKYFTLNMTMDLIEYELQNLFYILYF